MRQFVFIATLLLIAGQANADGRRDHGRGQYSNHGVVVQRDQRSSDDRDRDRHRDSDWDRYHRSYTYRSPAFFRPEYGRVERRLPDRHIVVRAYRHPYYYYNGIFYDDFGGNFVIVNAPIGAYVPMLPDGFISFWIGPTRYFYFGGTYYIHSGDQYQVVAPPESGQKIVNTAQEQLIIYPAKGQSQKQLDSDRYACHLWAVKQTGFDPSANNPNLSLKPDYNRAMSACLEARGYVVK